MLGGKIIFFNLSTFNSIFLIKAISVSHDVLGKVTRKMLNLFGKENKFSFLQNEMNCNIELHLEGEE